MPDNQNTAPLSDARLREIIERLHYLKSSAWKGGKWWEEPATEQQRQDNEDFLAHAPADMGVLLNELRRLTGRW